MGLILLLAVAVLVVAIIALALVAYTGQRVLDERLPVGPHPDTVPIRPDYVRCTVRANRASVISQGWEDVRLSFYLSGARRPVRQLSYGRWSREAMHGFEDRLVELGFMRTAAESFEDAPRRFHRTQHFVIFTREEVRRQT